MKKLLILAILASLVLPVYAKTKEPPLQNYKAFVEAYEELCIKDGYFNNIPECKKEGWETFKNSYIFPCPD